MSIRRIHWTDVTKAYRNLERNRKPKPYSKHVLTAEISRVTGVRLDPKNMDDWSRDIYSNCIVYMREKILDTFLYYQFGHYDIDAILKYRLQTIPSFENSMKQITDGMRAPYKLKSEYYVKEKTRHIKDVVDTLKPWELSKEDAQALSIRIQNLNYLWEKFLDECERVDGMIFLSGRFRKKSGYAIPEYHDILRNLEEFITSRSKQIIAVIVQYMAMGGAETTSLLESRKTMEAIEHQQTVQQLITNGPRLITCPMGCGKEFAINDDLRNHLIKYHQAKRR